MNGCSSTRSIFGLESPEAPAPISNPFLTYSKDAKGDNSQNMVLRTKKWDRQIEIEIPDDSRSIGEFSVPITSGESSDGGNNSNIDDLQYKDHVPTISDREISRDMTATSPDDEQRQRDIESGLYLKPSADPLTQSKSVSYLARIDHIKQLYRSSRYEVALIESDDLLREYPYDSKLYEMRGTLLDRLGRAELALKAWNQSLRLNPKNSSLRKYIARRQFILSSQSSSVPTELVPPTVPLTQPPVKSELSP